MIDKKSSEIGDDILVAYADNELPEKEMSRLAPLIAADLKAKNKVKAFRKSAEQLRNFFSVETSQEIPSDIAEKIRGIEVSETYSENVISLPKFREKNVLLVF